MNSFRWHLWLISSKQARNYMSRRSEKLLDKQQLREGEFNVRRVQVESLDQFRIMAQRTVEAYILLADGDEGTIWSSKRVQYQHSRNGRYWWMYDYIGDSECCYTERQFASSTNIVEAIGKAALYVELDTDR
jgi:hypothetical protein